MLTFVIIYLVIGFVVAAFLDGLTEPHRASDPAWVPFVGHAFVTLTWPYFLALNLGLILRLYLRRGGR